MLLQIEISHVANHARREKDGKVKRGVCAPALSFEGSVSTIRKAGSGWNDLLTGINKASGVESTIEHY